MKTASQKVDTYINNHEKWEDELNEIRAVFNATELNEDLKWGSPTYTFQNKNILGMVGFKNHLGIWFHQGVFLKDVHKKLISAEKSTAKAMRQWKVTKEQPIDFAILKEYTLEAIENQKAGKELKPQKKQLIDSTFLQKALAENTTLNTAFKKLTPGKQNEYMEFVSTAKQDATKLRRLEKIKPLILAGKGLNDQYKSC